MCRYGLHHYREQYACLACRRCFKIERERGTGLCPACRTPLVPMGRDFKAPKRGATTQWRKVELLIQAGLTFGVGHCGCGGFGDRPNTLAEAKRFVSASRAAADREVRRSVIDNAAF